MWWGVQLVSIISSVHLVSGVVRLRRFRVIGQCERALWGGRWRWVRVSVRLVVSEVVSVVTLGVVLFLAG